MLRGVLSSWETSLSRRLRRVALRLQGGRHLVESAAHLPQFVRGGNRQQGGIPALRNGAEGLGQGGNRSGDAFGEPGRQQEGNGDCQQSASDGGVKQASDKVS